MWSLRAAFLLAFGAATSAGWAQAPGSIGRLELQLHGLALAGRGGFAGGGGGIGWRFPGRTVASLGVTIGDRSGTEVRAEGLLRYRFDPRRTEGVTTYVLAGLAAELVDGNEFITVGAGVESRPGRRNSWFLEVGTGGGIRVSAGYRIRPGPRG